MEYPKTITSLLLNSEANITMVRMPKAGQIWINYQEMQSGGVLRLGGEQIKRGEGIYEAYAGAELTYYPPQNAHGVVELEVSWGYVNE